MIATLEIYHAEKRIKTDFQEELLTIELWENDNVCISNGLQDKGFEYEITKEDAVKLAKSILSMYS